jgi:hypothetical protein
MGPVGADGEAGGLRVPLAEMAEEHGFFTSAVTRILIELEGVIPSRQQCPVPFVQEATSSSTPVQIGPANREGYRSSEVILKSH